jgi:hypothetical protein
MHQELCKSMVFTILRSVIVICIIVAGCSGPSERPFDAEDERAVSVSCRDSIALWHRQEWKKLRRLFYPGSQFAMLSPAKEERLFRGMHSQGIDSEHEVQDFRLASLPKGVFEALVPLEYRSKERQPLAVTFRLGSRLYWQIWAKRDRKWFLLLPPLDLDEGTVAELKERLGRTK